MWVFGYGSLMWDDWYLEHACIRTAKATLPGYRRAFNKASSRNWGTSQQRCPTLNIIEDSGGSCVGLAFEFPDERRASVMAALEAREGRNFEFETRGVIVEDGTSVQAVTPRYIGRNLIGDKALTERAEMARLAAGIDGRCSDYIRNIADKLAELGIDDPVVREFSEAVR